MSLINSSLWQILLVLCNKKCLKKLQKWKPQKRKVRQMSRKGNEKLLKDREKEDHKRKMGAQELKEKESGLKLRGKKPVAQKTSLNPQIK